jgi:acetyl esterase/lipase
MSMPSKQPGNTAAEPPVRPAPPPGPPPVQIATTVRPADTSTSIVVEVDVADQLENGAVELDRHRDITFAVRTLADGTPLHLKLDLLVPRTGGAKPLVVCVPGGAYVMASKEGPADRKEHVAEAGFAVATVEYRTALHGAIYTDGVADVKSAIRYLRAHAHEYGIDASRVGVWGESAGGYVAAMVGVTDGDERFDIGADLGQSSAVQAVVDMFGNSDLAAHAADFDEDTQEFFRRADNSVAWYVYGMGSGTTFADDPDGAFLADPTTYIDSSAPPFLLFHGTDDRFVSPSQTRILHDVLRSAGVDSTRYVLQGAGHGDVVFLGHEESGLPWSSRQTMGYLITFLREHLADHAQISPPSA